MFRVDTYSFAVGDIVEKHYNGRWNYWTTIHHQWDADSAVALVDACVGIPYYRIVRGVRKDVIL